MCGYITDDYWSPLKGIKEEDSFHSQPIRWQFSVLSKCLACAKQQSCGHFTQEK